MTTRAEAYERQWLRHPGDHTSYAACAECGQDVEVDPFETVEAGDPPPLCDECDGSAAQTRTANSG